MPATAVDISRRNLLRGRLASLGERPLLPPWAVREQFTALCTRCNGCIEACPEGILVRADGGFPGVAFRRRECTFCGDCVTACKTGALSREPEREPWALKVRLDDGGRCLSVRGITCRSCGDSCSTRAIRFRPQVGGRADLHIDLALCTGCGACVPVCPAGVLKVEEPGGEEIRTSERAI